MKWRLVDFEARGNGRYRFRGGTSDGGGFYLDLEMVDGVLEIVDTNNRLAEPDELLEAAERFLESSM